MTKRAEKQKCRKLENQEDAKREIGRTTNVGVSVVTLRDSDSVEGSNVWHWGE